MKRDIMKQDGKESYTHKYQEHKPCGMGIKAISQWEPLNLPVTIYRGEDYMDQFFQYLRTYFFQVVDYLKINQQMIISDEQQRNHDTNPNVKCHICNKNVDLGADRVRDHDHFTGYFRGSVHNKCNLNYNYKQNQRKYDDIKIPVFIHNLQGYDGHLIIKGLKNQFKKITCIPLNTEKYLTITLDNFMFIDSYSFLSLSLEKLVANTRSEGNLEQNFRHTRALCQSLIKDSKDYSTLMDLLTRKGEYPYDYMDSFARFEETQLPPAEEFYSQLTKTSITPEDYAFAQNIWKVTECKTLGDYHDLYLKTDVCLLADVFENFRDLAIKYYELDPAYYVSLPSYAWDAMLLSTKVELYAFNDTQKDMYAMIEKSIRGGISMISNRFSKANHNKLTDYDPSEKLAQLIYLDANNLYGWAMSQHLPLDQFLWIPEPELFTTESIMNIADDAVNGYILEVDLEYPTELHDTHNDYPCAVEHVIPDESMWSPYSLDLAIRTEHKPSKVAKLIPNLKNKTKYVIHYRNLKLYLQLGLKLTHVHRVIQFHQEAWLKPYIDFNTNKRAKCSNDFEKDFFKLMNNAVFGKTMENVRNRIKFDLVTTESNNQFDHVNKLGGTPLYKKHTIFSEHVVGVEREQKEVKLNKPIIVGFSILDLSKFLMYRFHYNIMVKKYGNRLKLLFTDTDSLFYEIETDDLNRELIDLKDQMDFSNFPIDHPLFSKQNAKVVGKFKIENGHHIITEFVGLKPKMYSYLTLKEDKLITKKTLKGVNPSAKNEITHQQYKQCLNDDTFKLYSRMNSLRSFKHTIHSIEINKLSLSSWDDKKWYIDPATALSYGHYKAV